MPWRWGWPPWEPKQVRADQARALEAIERATLDLTDTRRRVARAERVAESLQHAKARNHFSESMEALFAARAPGVPRKSAEQGG